jgi:dTDP-glucose 4,6-dehydratase
MRILVTGGLGFIGSNLCRHIIATYPDYEIINVDKIGLGANPVNLKDLENEERYRFIKGDIRDSELVNKIVAEVDAVVNMAAETHVDRSIADPPSFMQNNTVGTFTVLEAIRKRNNEAKLVQVSTDEVYGETPEGSFGENDALRPSNPYSASKAAADMFALAYCKTYSLNVAVTRCTNNYGPCQLPEKLVPKTIIRALRGLKVPIYGSGKNVRDWIYVQDHCEAIALVLSEGDAGEVYNISSGNELTNIEIVRRILQLTGKDADLMTFVDDRPGHDIRYSLDSSKIRSKLGWKPRFSFKEALKLTVDWYVDNDWWWKPLATREILNPTPWKSRDTK